jgi:hypothetical protein
MPFNEYTMLWTVKENEQAIPGLEINTAINLAQFIV